MNSFCCTRLTVIYRVFIRLIAVVFLLSCDATRENDPPELTESSLSLALQQAVDFSVIPAVNAFQAQTSAMQKNAQQFCLKPTLANLTAAQLQWRTLSDSWFSYRSIDSGHSMTILYSRLTHLLTRCDYAERTTPTPYVMNY